MPWEPLNINTLLKAVKLKAAVRRRIRKNFYYYTCGIPRKRGGIKKIKLQGKHKMHVG